MLSLLAFKKSLFAGYWIVARARPSSVESGSRSSSRVWRRFPSGAAQGAALVWPKSAQRPIA
jgi:hypothetical protein